MKTKINERSFYAGVLVALSVVSVFDDEVQFHEIVETVDKDLLIKYARMDGQMRISGLSKYKYGRK